MIRLLASWKGLPTSLERWMAPCLHSISQIRRYNMLRLGLADEDSTAFGAALKLGVSEGEMDGPRLLDIANEGAWLRLGGTDGYRDTACFDDPDGAILG